MKYNLLICLLSYCAFISSCTSSSFPKKYQLGKRWSVLSEQKIDTLDPLFSDTVMAYFRTITPAIMSCNPLYKCHLLHGGAQKDSINNTLLLNYTYSKSSRHNIPIPEGDGRIHPPCYEHFINVLYSPEKQDYILLRMSDLKEDDKHYLLKSFLKRNDIVIPDTKTIFSYLYGCYGEKNMLFSSVCTPSYFVNLNEIQKISVNTNPKFGMREKDVEHLKTQMVSTVSRYQKDIENFYGGVMINLEPDIGKWVLYLFVVDKRNPINYEIFVYYTPRSEYYTWKWIS
jgi:hypothetical protein